MANLVPVLGIIFGCGIALLVIWTGHRGDRALREKSSAQGLKEEELATS